MDELNWMTHADLKFYPKVSYWPIHKTLGLIQECDSDIGGNIMWELTDLGHKVAKLKKDAS